MSAKAIGVGIIGATPGRGWAGTAHIPALRALPEFEVRALSTSRRDSAEAAAKEYGVPLAFDNHQELVSRPEIDLVVVSVKVPHHFELVSAAIGAGKAVFCEWPLGNGLAEAVELSRLAREKQVLAVTGLQSRGAPVVAYVRDLIREGYVGDVVSATLIGAGGLWAGVVDPLNLYLSDIRNGATMVTIPFGHTVDAFCWCLGEFESLSADLAYLRKTVTVVETGAVHPQTAADQRVVAGTLKTGGAAALQYRAGVPRGTKLLWEINGTEGDLRIASNHGHIGTATDVTLSGGRGATTTLEPLEIPTKYRWVPPAVPSGAPFNVAQIYAHFARDFHEGTHLSASFDDAVLRHRMIDAIEKSAETGRRQRYADGDA